MKEVTFLDGDGCKYKVSLPDEAPDEDAYKGIPIGPPDLSSLELPDALRVRLNNTLFDRGFFTKRDIRGRRAQELIGVWQAVLNTDIQRLQAVFELEGN